MKSKTLRFSGLCFAGLTAITFTQASLGQTTHVWDGGGADIDLGNALNWSTDAAPNGATGDIMRWDGTVAGNLSLSYDTAATLGASPGVSFDVTAGQTDSLTVDGTLGSGLRLGAAGVSIASGAGAVTFGNGSVDAFNFTVANTNVSLTNNSLNTATFKSDVKFAVTFAGNSAMQFGGSGDWDVEASLSPVNSGARIALLKTGAGELTLSGGGSLRGGATINGGTGFSAVFKEGTTRITGGTYANNASELVVGGSDATGANTHLIMDGGSLTGISWLSVGRGNNGAGGTSNVTLNNNASITSTNMSLGFNPGTGAPVGTVTLNGTSSITTNGINNIGESSGSNMTMTLNNSSSFSSSNQLVEVGQNNGQGTVNVNGSSTMSVGLMRIGRGANSGSTAKGFVNVGGGTLNVEGDLVLGYAGSGAGGNVGRLTIDSGTVNVATTTKRWMILNQWDTSKGELNVNGGNLNLNAGTDLRFSTGNGSSTGTSVVNLNGGAITSYSGNQTGTDGAGVVDLNFTGGVAANNTFNLNGGTLSVRAVITTNNNATAAFNFNGGTLKATGDDANFINLDGASSTQTLNVLAGGAFIDSNGHTVDVVEDMAGPGALTKQGSGVLRLLGGGNSLGAATVSAGTLYINGSLGTTSGTTVASGATIGAGDGDGGTLSGGLHIAAGGSIDVTQGVLTLASGTLSFDGFGLDDLVGLDVYTAAEGTYTIIGGSSFTLDTANLANLGWENALMVGANKYAYFQEGSLDVVVIPEPGAVLLGGLGLFGLLRRRRS
ncbi:MAG: PEP-CTERM sorting domain-containing protein [Akkermansiaceae bacterium]|nr:PEP-CTERM sorting domain-containing protein [Akkermansiaceae bacterium]